MEVIKHLLIYNPRWNLLNLVQDALRFLYGSVMPLFSFSKLFSYSLRL